MAINFDALRKRLDNLSGNNKKSSASWKPKEGEEYTIRLLSFPNNEGQPFKELWFYYNIGNNPGLLAPYQFGKADPIQDLIQKLRDEGTKESYELAKKLYPKMRCYAPVVVRGEEDKGVQIWAFGKQVYQTLLGIMLDEDYGDITDPESGRDVKVKCYKLPGKKFAETEVMPRGKASTLSSNAGTAKQWLTNVPDVSKMFELKSSDELTKIVNDWINGGMQDGDGTTRGGPTTDDDSDTGTTTTVSASKTTAVQNTNTTKKSGNYSSIDDAFEDLMGD
jgi:hypothetical protein